MSECLIYQIKPGKTLVRPRLSLLFLHANRLYQVGNLSETAADIRLSGDSILPEHCFFENSPEGKVVLHAMADSTTMVNGQRIAPDKVSTRSVMVRLRTDDVNRSRRN
jgi:kinesin family protein 1